MVNKELSQIIKITTGDVVELPAGDTADVQNSYKYFGIQQANGSTKTLQSI